MTVHGHVRNGAIVLDTPTTLPEGALVMIRIIAPESEAKITAKDRPILRHSGAIKGLGPDASRAELTKNFTEHFEQAGFRILLGN